jgi:hypothetical protein
MLKLDFDLTDNMTATLKDKVKNYTFTKVSKHKMRCVFKGNLLLIASFCKDQLNGFINPLNCTFNQYQY